MMKRINLIIAGFIVLATVAVAGWVRQPAPAVSYAQPALTPLAPVQAVSPEPVYAAPAVYRRPVRVQRVARQTEAAPVREVAVVEPRERPFSHSVAIVAGGAGAGAAVGTIAGGKKGAAIGALSGGAAALIYDRVTHKR